MNGTDRGPQAWTAALLARAQVTSNAYHLRDEKLADEVSARALQLAEKQAEPSSLAEALLGSNRAAAEAHLALARASSTPTEKRSHASEALSFARRFADEPLLKEVQAFVATLPGGLDAGPRRQP
jgi:thioredoxin-like negative regulator of GroEL